MTVSPTSGNGNGSVTVSYQQNSIVDQRQCIITVSASGVSNQTFTLTQQGANPTLTISPTSATVSPSSGSTTFSVTSNTNWTVSESCDWVTVSPLADSGNKVVTVNYSANTSSSPRQCQIIVGLNNSIMIETFNLSQDGLTSIDKFDYSSNIPNDFYLAQNYPNPFNPSTSLKFGLKEEAIVTLKIYDITGVLVSELLSNEVLSAGTYSYRFEANNLTSSIYLYSISAIATQGSNIFNETKKMILLR